MSTSATMSRKRPSPGSNTPIITTNTINNTNGSAGGAFLRPAPDSPSTLSPSPMSAGYGPQFTQNSTSTTNGDGGRAYNLAGTGRAAAGPHVPQQQTFSPMTEQNQLARVPKSNSLIRVHPNPQYFMQGNMTGAVESSQGAGGGINSEVFGDLATQIRKAKGKKANIPPFVQKLSQFVNDPKCDHLIRWSPGGESFLVLDEDEFSKTLIPDLFKHNNYASFVRQLNMYGFHKVVGLADGSLKTSEQRSKPPSEYKNPYFKRGQPDLMWLIHKPKNNAKRKKGKKGKAEESEDEDMSDSGGMPNTTVEEGHVQPIGGGYIEGPPTTHPNHPQNVPSRFDFSHIMQQLEAVKSHQALISQAINRLRKEHQQLYDQSVAFQTLHDRHETSISAILTFLATVYDKSLGGINSQSLANLFAGAMDQNQNGGTVISNPNTAVTNVGGRTGMVGAGANRQGVPTAPFKRRPPLMLPPVPPNSTGSTNANDPNEQNQNNSFDNQQTSPDGSRSQFSYQSPTIQEVFTPTPSGPVSPPPMSPSLSNPVLSGLFPPGMFTQQGSPSGSQQSQTQLTPRMQRDLTPLLKDHAISLRDHRDRVEQTSQVLDHVKHLQDAQDENINKLIEIVGPFSTATTSAAAPAPVDPNSNLSNTSSKTHKNPQQILSNNCLGNSNNAPMAFMNNNQTSPPALYQQTNGTASPHESNILDSTITGDPSDDMFDVEQYLRDDWPLEGLESYTTGGDHSATDLELFAEDAVIGGYHATSYGLPGIMDSMAIDGIGSLHNNHQGGGVTSDPSSSMGNVDNLGANGNGNGSGGVAMGCIDGGGQILGTNPSTAVGSPNSTAYSDGNLSLNDGFLSELGGDGGVGVGVLDFDDGLGNRAGDMGGQTGTAKKKRRVG